MNAQEQLRQDPNLVYEFGEVFDALDACDELEQSLKRLRRHRVLDDSEFRGCAQNVEEVREHVVHHIDETALKPKGPTLP